MRLEDKVALVTGAGSGIGLESSLALAREGARVVAVDVDVEAGEAAAAKVRETGGEVCFVRADVSSATDSAAMVAAAEDRYGALHVLFNNAGISHADDADAIDTDEAVWDLTMNVNLKGVFATTDLALDDEADPADAIDPPAGTAAAAPKAAGGAVDFSFYAAFWGLQKAFFQPAAVCADAARWKQAAADLQSVLDVFGAFEGRRRERLPRERPA